MASGVDYFSRFQDNNKNQGDKFVLVMPEQRIGGTFSVFCYGWKSTVAFSSPNNNKKNFDIEQHQTFLFNRGQVFIIAFSKFTRVNILAKIPYFFPAFRIFAYFFPPPGKNIYPCKIFWPILLFYAQPGNNRNIFLTCSSRGFANESVGKISWGPHFSKISLSLDDQGEQDEFYSTFRVMSFFLFPIFPPDVFNQSLTNRNFFIGNSVAYCLAFSLRFWPKIKQLLSNWPASDWTFSFKKADFS